MSILKKYENKTGKTPGHLYYTGDKKDKTKIEIINYNQEDFSEKTYEFKTKEDFENVLKIIPKDNILWINVFGLNDLELISYIGEKFGIPKLNLEDALHIGQRPKMDSIENEYIFLLLNMIKKDEKIIYEQISIFVKDNNIITFQEVEGDVFNPIRERIKAKKGIIRTKDIDYLFYILLDILLDNYFIFMMNMEESVETLEENAMVNQEDDLLKDIYYYKKELVKLRNSIFPLKEIVKTLKNNSKEKKDKYYDDLYDHLYFMIDNLNVFREMINGIYDIYISNISNRMNKIMTVLTIFSAIFIPMTFLAGVYGMNFKYIPGLNNPFSFYIFIGICIGILVIMLEFFRRKRWL